MKRPAALDVERIALPNGIDCAFIPLPHLHTATMTFVVRAGSRYEDRRTNGLSHFLEHMLFRGSERFPTPFDLNLAFEKHGGTVYGATHVDHTVYQLAAPPEHLPEILSVFADALIAPLFTGIETEKHIVAEELLEAIDEDGKDVDPDDVARALLFGAHPLGLKIAGSPSTVASFTEDDLFTLLRERYVAEQLVFSIAGSFDRAAIGEAARNYLGALRRGAAHVAGSPPTFGSSRFAYVDTDGSQSELRISYPTFGERDPRAIALDLLGSLLDDGMAARVPRRIRDELGLAYDAFAAPDVYEDCGVLDFGATVEHAKAGRVAEALFELAYELAAHRVSDDELDRAKRRYVWGMRALIDAPSEVSSYFATSRLFQIDEPPHLRAERALAVTPEDVRAVAAAVFVKPQARLTCVGALSEAQEDDLRALTTPSH